MLNDKRSRVEKRKEVVSTLSDDSGCVTETTDTTNTNQDSKKEPKIDVPYVPNYADDSDDVHLPKPENRSVRTLKVHFEFLATTPFNPLKRPNWWIGDEDSSDTDSTKSEPDDVNSNKNSTRPVYQRPYSSPNSLCSDKININIANNIVQNEAITTDINTAVDSINCLDNIPRTR